MNVYVTMYLNYLHKMNTHPNKTKIYFRINLQTKPHQKYPGFFKKSP